MTLFKELSNMAKIKISVTIPADHINCLYEQQFQDLQKYIVIHSTAFRTRFLRIIQGIELVFEISDLYLTVIHVNGEALPVTKLNLIRRKISDLMEINRFSLGALKHKKNKTDEDHQIINAFKIRDSKK